MADDVQDNGSEAAGRLWGGRFASGPAPALQALSRSTQVDWRLAPYDLLQTQAYVIALAAAGLVTDAERDLLAGGVQALAEGVASGDVVPSPDDEDVHGALERLLIERVGDIGSRVRFGRSRNDQVATDLRLYLRDAARDVAATVLGLLDALVDAAESVADVIAPGFTHLQHAQPLFLGHELAKHAHRLERDLGRLRDWDERAAVSPLGASAVAGTAAPVDVDVLATALGFDRAADNSIDATTDRDFVAELCFVASLIGVHLSQLGEEVCLWTSTEFGWATLDDAWSTGSSIMPQKKNPDIAELARGKAGRLVGDLVSVLTTLKGLPFGYNRDLQEDKEPVFDAVDTLLLTVPALTGLVRTLRFDGARIAASATAGHALATEIADWLAVRGVPFREAHELAGACVREAEATGVELVELTDAQLVQISPHLAPDVRGALTSRAAVAVRRQTGGTARLSEQLAGLRGRAVGHRAWSQHRGV